MSRTIEQRSTVPTNKRCQSKLLVLCYFGIRYKWDGNCFLEPNLVHHQIIKAGDFELKLISFFHYGLVLFEHSCLRTVKVKSHRQPAEHNVGFPGLFRAFLRRAGLLIISLSYVKLSQGLNKSHRGLRIHVYLASVSI